MSTPKLPAGTAGPLSTDPSPLPSFLAQSHTKWCVAGVVSKALAAFPFLGAGVACSCKLTSLSSISSLLLKVTGRGHSGGLVTCAGAGTSTGGGHSGALVIDAGTGGAGMVPIVMSCGGILMGIVPASPVNFTLHLTLTDLFCSQ